MEAKDTDGNYYINNNGVWTNTTLNLPELIATYMKVWFEDSVPTDLLNSMKETKGRYTSERQKAELTKVYAGLIDLRMKELEQLLSKLESQLEEIITTQSTNA